MGYTASSGALCSVKMGLSCPLGQTRTPFNCSDVRSHSVQTWSRGPLAKLHMLLGTATAITTSRPARRDDALDRIPASSSPTTYHHGADEPPTGSPCQSAAAVKLREAVSSCLFLRTACIRDASPQGRIPLRAVS
jgi:hypothetical protein